MNQVRNIENIIDNVIRGQDCDQNSSINNPFHNLPVYRFSNKVVFDLSFPRKRESRLSCKLLDTCFRRYDRSNPFIVLRLCIAKMPYVQRNRNESRNRNR